MTGEKFQKREQLIMSKEKDRKTNAIREMEAAHADFDTRFFECPEALSGMEVAALLEQDPDCVFKTLVTQGKSGQHFVFMIPVACELDLKKAARAAGEKSIAMVKSRDLLGLTGYIHGGCSPVGMKKLFPTFGKKMLSEIETRDIIAWQNELLAYRDEKNQPYSPTYLKSIHNQLVAILNHAVRHYRLKSNPASKVGYIGSKEAEEMQFWTKEEYQRFAEAVMDKPMSYYAFEMLYWCGIREGELLALTPGDFNFKAGTVSINKSYQRLHGEDVITTPKTKKSIRTIKMPKFLCEEMQEYIQSLYGVKKRDRIFPVTKNYLYHEMDRGCRASGVKRIRVHDIRHSHVSLLIDMGFSAVAIADRVGHESIDITYRYAHLFPSKQAEMANKLDDERMVNLNVG